MEGAKIVANALVTGASSGIGLSTARRLAQRGHHVLMLSYDEPELQQASQDLVGQATPVLCDLSQPDQVDGLFARLEGLYGPIEILINNAGIGHHGEVTETSMETFRRVMEVNYFAPLNLCQQALTAMKERRRGHILNLTSASARRPLARMGAYGSSKAALHGLTQTMRLEAHPYQVRVSEVLPISVTTPFFERASNTSQRLYRPMGFRHSPDQVADMVMRCLDRNIGEYVTHTPTALGLALDALMPNFVSRLLVWSERLTARRNRRD